MTLQSTLLQGLGIIKKISDWGVYGVLWVTKAVLHVTGAIFALTLFAGAAVLVIAATVMVAALIGGALGLYWLFEVVTSITTKLTGTSSHRDTDLGPDHISI